MNCYKRSEQLRALSRGQLLNNYGTAIPAVLLPAIITGTITFIAGFSIDTRSISGIVFYYAIAFLLSLVNGIFAVGQTYLYFNIICGRPFNVSDIFYGFKVHPDRAISVRFFLSAICYLAMIPGGLLSTVALALKNPWIYLIASLLTVAGGFIAIYVQLSCSQVFCLMLDFPTYTSKELLTVSRNIMKGHKARLFYIIVGFLPLIILGFLSCCIGLIFIIPYMQITMVNFYLDLISNKNSKDNATM